MSSSSVQASALQHRARALALELDILVLEKGSDVASGATRANSGIVHGGYDPVPGTLKAKYNRLGSLRYPELARELSFGYINNGSFVVAFSEDERPAVESLLARGKKNGIEGLEILEHDALLAREPNLSPAAVCALGATGASAIPMA